MKEPYVERKFTEKRVLFFFDFSKLDKILRKLILFCFQIVCINGNKKE